VQSDSGPSSLSAETNRAIYKNILDSQRAGQLRNALPVATGNQDNDPRAPQGAGKGEVK